MGAYTQTFQQIHYKITSVVLLFKKVTLTLQFSFQHWYSVALSGGGRQGGTNSHQMGLKNEKRREHRVQVQCI